jgi:hypothetical protein
VGRRDLERVGKKYRVKHAGFAPDRLHVSGRKSRRLGKKAVQAGIGWICRLAQAGPELLHGVIHLKQLGLDHLDSEENLWIREAVLEIKNAVRRVTCGPFYARLEAGSEARRIHVHVLTHEPLSVACALEPVRDLEKMASYLAKAPAPRDDLAIGTFLEGRKQSRAQGKNLPRLAFWRGIPRA